MKCKLCGADMINDFDENGHWLSSECPSQGCGYFID